MLEQNSGFCDSMYIYIHSFTGKVMTDNSDKLVEKNTCMAHNT